jgi:putative transposase
MEHGFMYLVAIIDVFSRCIMAWGLYNSLDAANSIEVLRRAIELHGLPEIINSDQGCQYTSEAWINTCSELGITISMDGKGRCRDNIWIERFWRTIKYEYIYLNPADDVNSLRIGIKTYIEYYNASRAHQGIDHQVPLIYYNEHRLVA